MRKPFATAMAVTALAIAPGAAMAAPPQNGLVNVNVGDITVEDVTIGVAAQLAAQVCGVSVGPVAVLGRAVDRSGDTRTVCESDQGPVTISDDN